MNTGQKGGSDLRMRADRETTGISGGRSGGRQVPLLMRVPVPWVFALAYLAGVGLQHWMPAVIPSAQSLVWFHYAGGGLMLAGAAIAAWSLGLFRTARTTTTPGEASNELVTWGPYRWSRNPMYISLTLCYLGEAGILAQVWPLLLLPLVLAYLQQTVIPVEETRLRETFGADYDRYRAAVRRWL